MYRGSTYTFLTQHGTLNDVPFDVLPFYTLWELDLWTDPAYTGDSTMAKGSKHTSLRNYSQALFLYLRNALDAIGVMSTIYKVISKSNNSSDMDRLKTIYNGNYMYFIYHQIRLRRPWTITSKCSKLISRNWIGSRQFTCRVTLNCPHWLPLNVKGLYELLIAIWLIWDTFARRKCSYQISPGIYDWLKCLKDSVDSIVIRTKDLPPPFQGILVLFLLHNVSP